MTNPKTVVYTFRKVKDAPLTVEAVKWDEMVSDEVPVEIYTVRPENAGYFRCSCPAYRECKHVRVVLEAMEDGKIDELWSWTWSEKLQWTKVGDIRTIEELNAEDDDA